MYESDIKLDRYGNSVITNGDFVLTEDDSDFICRMLTTTPGSWELHPELGVGLQEFIGRLDTENIIREMKSRINDFFKRYALFPNSTIYSLDDNTLIVSLDFYAIDSDESLNVTFSFNLENGNIKLVEDEVDEEQVVQSRNVVNKYMERR